MKRFVSLIAVSSEKQATPDKVSLSDQRDSIAKEIARWNGVLAEELEIPGHTRAYTSLQEAERELPAYRRLHELIVAGTFDVLIFFNYSRLARDIGLGGNVVSLCQKHKIVLYPASSPPSDLDFRHDAMNLFLASFGLTSSHNEVAEIIRRHRMGMPKRIARGEFPGVVPWGWKTRYTEQGEKIVEVDEQAKQTLLTICNLYLEGKGANTIAKHLNVTGVQTPAGEYSWREQNVNRLIGGIRKYAGMTWVNKRSKTGREYAEAPSRWPSLIDSDMAAKVEAEQNYRRRGSRYVESPHRFSGMILCAECGEVMNCIHTHSHGGRYRYEIARCPNGCQQLVAHRVEAALRKFFTGDEFFQILSEEYTATDDTEKIRLEGLISTVQKELARCDDSIARINDLYAIEMSIDKPERDRMLAKVKERQAVAQEKVRSYQAALLREEHNSRRKDELIELQKISTFLLDTEDVVTANAALRPYLRVWVRDYQVEDVEPI